MGQGLTGPVPISAEHDSAGFSCGETGLHEWLRRRAFKNSLAGATRTFVVCDGSQIVGYFALASGGLSVGSATGRFRRNMPDPIPVAILARLAIDVRYKGLGLGRALFRDAAIRILSAADAIGIRGLVVHALSDDAVRFYEALGLMRSPEEPRTLMITLDELRASL